MAVTSSCWTCARGVRRRRTIWTGTSRWAVLGDTAGPQPRTTPCRPGGGGGGVVVVAVGGGGSGRGGGGDGFVCERERDTSRLLAAQLGQFMTKLDLSVDPALIVCSC